MAVRRTTPVQAVMAWTGGRPQAVRKERMPVSPLVSNVLAQAIEEIEARGSRSWGARELVRHIRQGVLGGSRFIPTSVLQHLSGRTGERGFGARGRVSRQGQLLVIRPFPGAPLLLEAGELPRSERHLGLLVRHLAGPVPGLAEAVAELVPREERRRWPKLVMPWHPRMLDAWVRVNAPGLVEARGVISPPDLPAMEDRARRAAGVSSAHPSFSIGSFAARPPEFDLEIGWRGLTSEEIERWSNDVGLLFYGDSEVVSEDAYYIAGARLGFSEEDLNDGVEIPYGDHEAVFYDLVLSQARDDLNQAFICESRDGRYALVRFEDEPGTQVWSTIREDPAGPVLPSDFLGAQETVEAAVGLAAVTALGRAAPSANVDPEAEVNTPGRADRWLPRTITVLQDGEAFNVVAPKRGGFAIVPRQRLAGGRGRDVDGSGRGWALVHLATGLPLGPTLRTRDDGMAIADRLLEMPVGWSEIRLSTLVEDERHSAALETVRVAVDEAVSSRRAELAARARGAGADRMKADHAPFGPASFAVITAVETPSFDLEEAEQLGDGSGSDGWWYEHEGLRNWAHDEWDPIGLEWEAAKERVLAANGVHERFPPDADRVLEVVREELTNLVRDDAGAVIGARNAYEIEKDAVVADILSGRISLDAAEIPDDHLQLLERHGEAVDDLVVERLVPRALAQLAAQGESDTDAVVGWIDDHIDAVLDEADQAMWSHYDPLFRGAMRVPDAAGLGYEFILRPADGTILVFHEDDFVDELTGWSPDGSPAAHRAWVSACDVASRHARNGGRLFDGPANDPGGEAWTRRGSVTIVRNPGTRKVQPGFVRGTLGIAHVRPKATRQRPSGWQVVHLATGLPIGPQLRERERALRTADGLLDSGIDFGGLQHRDAPAWLQANRTRIETVYHDIDFAEREVTVEAAREARRRQVARDAPEAFSPAAFAVGTTITPRPAPRFDIAQIEDLETWTSDYGGGGWTDHDGLSEWISEEFEGDYTAWERAERRVLDELDLPSEYPVGPERLLEYMAREMAAPPGFECALNAAVAEVLADLAGPDADRKMAVLSRREVVDLQRQIRQGISPDLTDDVRDLLHQEVLERAEWGGLAAKQLALNGEHDERALTEALREGDLSHEVADVFHEMRYEYGCEELAGARIVEDLDGLGYSIVVTSAGDVLTFAPGHGEAHRELLSHDFVRGDEIGALEDAIAIAQAHGLTGHSWGSSAASTLNAVGPDQWTSMTETIRIAGGGTLYRPRAGEVFARRAFAVVRERPSFGGQRPRQAGWQIVHLPSGLRVGDRVGTAREAMALVEALEPIAPWHTFVPAAAAAWVASNGREIDQIFRSAAAEQRRTRAERARQERLRRHVRDAGSGPFEGAAFAVSEPGAFARIPPLSLTDLQALSEHDHEALLAELDEFFDSMGAYDEVRSRTRREWETANWKEIVEVCAPDEADPRFVRLVEEAFEPAQLQLERQFASLAGHDLPGGTEAYQRAKQAFVEAGLGAKARALARDEAVDMGMLDSTAVEELYYGGGGGDAECAATREAFERILSGALIHLDGEEGGNVIVATGDPEFGHILVTGTGFLVEAHGLTFDEAVRKASEDDLEHDGTPQAHNAPGPAQWVSRDAIRLAMDGSDDNAAPLRRKGAVRGPLGVYDVGRADGGPSGWQLVHLTTGHTLSPHPLTSRSDAIEAANEVMERVDLAPLQDSGLHGWITSGGAAEVMKVVQGIRHDSRRRQVREGRASALRRMQERRASAEGVFGMAEFSVGPLDVPHFPPSASVPLSARPDALERVAAALVTDLAREGVFAGLEQLAQAKVFSENREEVLRRCPPHVDDPTMVGLRMEVEEQARLRLELEFQEAMDGSLPAGEVWRREEAAFIHERLPSEMDILAREEAKVRGLYDKEAFSDRWREDIEEAMWRLADADVLSRLDDAMLWQSAGRGSAAAYQLIATTDAEIGTVLLHNGNEILASGLDHDGAVAAARRHDLTGELGTAGRTYLNAPGPEHGWTRRLAIVIPGSRDQDGYVRGSFGVVRAYGHDVVRRITSPPGWQVVHLGTGMVVDEVLPRREQAMAVAEQMESPAFPDATPPVDWRGLTLANVDEWRTANGAASQRVMAAAYTVARHVDGVRARQSVREREERRVGSSTDPFGDVAFAVSVPADDLRDVATSPPAFLGATRPAVAGSAAFALGKRDLQKEFLEELNEIGRQLGRDQLEVFRDWLEAATTALAQKTVSSLEESVRLESRYMDVVKRMGGTPPPAVHGLPRAHEADVARVKRGRPTWPEAVEGRDRALAAMQAANDDETRQERAREAAAWYAVSVELQPMSRCARMLGTLFEEMGRNPGQDVLGPIFMELKSKGGRDARGQFFTPYTISALMAEMTAPSADDVLRQIRETGRPFTVAEPASGSGANVLAMADAFRNRDIDPARTMFVTAIDIDPVCAHMAFVQLGAARIPARVIHGNGLTDEVFDSWLTPPIRTLQEEFTVTPPSAEEALQAMRRTPAAEDRSAALFAVGGVDAAVSARMDEAAAWLLARAPEVDVASAPDIDQLANLIESSGPAEVRGYLSDLLRTAADALSDRGVSAFEAVRADEPTSLGEAFAAVADHVRNHETAASLDSIASKAYHSGRRRMQADFEAFRREATFSGDREGMHRPRYGIGQAASNHGQALSALIDLPPDQLPELAVLLQAAEQRATVPALTAGAESYAEILADLAGTASEPVRGVIRPLVAEAARGAKEAQSVRTAVARAVTQQPRVNPLTVARVRSHPGILWSVPVASLADRLAEQEIHARGLRRNSREPTASALFEQVGSWARENAPEILAAADVAAARFRRGLEDQAALVETALSKGSWEEIAAAAKAAGLAIQRGHDDFTASWPGSRSGFTSRLQVRPSVVTERLGRAPTSFWKLLEQVAQKAGADIEHHVGAVPSIAPFASHPDTRQGAAKDIGVRLRMLGERHAGFSRDATTQNARSLTHRLAAVLDTASSDASVSKVLKAAAARADGRDVFFDVLDSLADLSARSDAAGLAADFKATLQTVVDAVTAAGPSASLFEYLANAALRAEAEPGVPHAEEDQIGSIVETMERRLKALSEGAEQMPRKVDHVAAAFVERALTDPRGLAAALDTAITVAELGTDDLGPAGIALFEQAEGGRSGLLVALRALQKTAEMAERAEIGDLLAEALTGRLATGDEGLLRSLREVSFDRLAVTPAAQPAEARTRDTAAALASARLRGFADWLTTAEDSNQVDSAVRWVAHAMQGGGTLRQVAGRLLARIGRDETRVGSDRAPKLAPGTTSAIRSLAYGLSALDDQRPETNAVLQIIANRRGRQMPPLETILPEAIRTIADGSPQAAYALGAETAPGRPTISRGQGKKIFGGEPGTYDVHTPITVDIGGQRVTFIERSSDAGSLRWEKDSGRLVVMYEGVPSWMDFPSDPDAPATYEPLPPDIAAALQALVDAEAKALRRTEEFDRRLAGGHAPGTAAYSLGDEKDRYDLDGDSWSEDEAEGAMARAAAIGAGGAILGYLATRGIGEAAEIVHTLMHAGAPMYSAGDQAQQAVEEVRRSLVDQVDDAALRTVLKDLGSAHPAFDAVAVDSLGDAFRASVAAAVLAADELDARVSYASGVGGRSAIFLLAPALRPAVERTLDAIETAVPDIQPRYVPAATAEIDDEIRLMRGPQETGVVLQIARDARSISLLHEGKDDVRLRATVVVDGAPAEDVVRALAPAAITTLSGQAVQYATGRQQDDTDQAVTRALQAAYLSASAREDEAWTKLGDARAKLEGSLRDKGMATATARKWMSVVEGKADLGTERAKTALAFLEGRAGAVELGHWLAAARAFSQASDEAHRSAMELAVHGGLEARLDAEALTTMGAIKTGLLAVAARINPTVDIRFVRELYGEGPALIASGAASEHRRPVAGMFQHLYNLATISTSPRFDALDTTYHESFHTIEPLLTHQEADVLRKAFPPERGMTTSERAAVAFAAWATRRHRGLDGDVAKIFRKGTGFGAGVAAVLKQNGVTKTEQLFEKIYAGEMACRALAATRNAAAAGYGAGAPAYAAGGLSGEWGGLMRSPNRATGSLSQIDPDNTLKATALLLAGAAAVTGAVRGVRRLTEGLLKAKESAEVRFDALVPGLDIPEAATKLAAVADYATAVLKVGVEPPSPFVDLMATARIGYRTVATDGREMADVDGLIAEVTEADAAGRPDVVARLFAKEWAITERLLDGALQADPDNGRQLAEKLVALGVPAMLDNQRHREEATEFLVTAGVIAAGAGAGATAIGTLAAAARQQGEHPVRPMLPDGALSSADTVREAAVGGAASTMPLPQVPLSEPSIPDVPLPKPELPDSVADVVGHAQVPVTEMVEAAWHNIGPRVADAVTGLFKVDETCDPGYVVVVGDERASSKAFLPSWNDAIDLGGRALARGEPVHIMADDGEMRPLTLSVDVRGALGDVGDRLSRVGTAAGVGRPRDLQASAAGPIVATWDLADQRQLEGLRAELASAGYEVKGVGERAGGRIHLKLTPVDANGTDVAAGVPVRRARSGQRRRQGPDLGM